MSLDYIWNPNEDTDLSYFYQGSTSRPVACLRRFSPKHEGVVVDSVLAASSIPIMSILDDCCAAAQHELVTSLRRAQNQIEDLVVRRKLRLKCGATSANSTLVDIFGGAEIQALSSAEKQRYKRLKTKNKYKFNERDVERYTIISARLTQQLAKAFMTCLAPRLDYHRYRCFLKFEGTKYGLFRCGDSEFSLLNQVSGFDC